MILRFLTKAARWMGALYLPFTETWVPEKEEWILMVVLNFSCNFDTAARRGAVFIYAAILK